MSEHNRLIKSRLREALRTRVSTYLGGRLVDIGCGVKPYGDLLEGLVTAHVGVEHAKTPHGLAAADLVGTAYAIPAKDESFDSALCTEVLEHLEDPGRALQECARVLKPGAHAIYTTPFIWHLHEEPRDFFRYTEYGLRYLFEQNGFEVIEITPLTGFWATFGQLLVYVLHGYDRGFLRRTHLVRGLEGLLQRGAGWLDRRQFLSKWPSHYITVARRKISPAPDA